MNYQMTITLESDLCVGSGESRGNAIDLDLCTNANGVPYIPARRLKGCLRETAEFLAEAGQTEDFSCASEENIGSLFGDAYGREGLLTIHDAHLPDAALIDTALRRIRTSGRTYLYRAAHPEGVKRIYTAVRGQTRLEDGLKVDGTLRFTRVLTKYNALFNVDKPLCFIAEVSINSEDGRLDKLEELLEACCSGTRHIGNGRNRGLGNVAITLSRKEAERAPAIPDFVPEPDSEYCMEYRILLESPVTIPDFGRSMTMIPGRSMIGCLSACFAGMDGQKKEQFDDLFLNGTVRWSALTPVLEGRRTNPAPNFIMKLKNDGGKLINIFAQPDSAWKSLKPKTVSESYAVQAGEGIRIADVRTGAVYHNSMKQSMLYTQESVNAGYIYGGTVTFPGRYYRDIKELLTSARIRFGRSKNAQYANCRLLEILEPQKPANPVRLVSGTVYVVLESDLAVIEEGRYITENRELREYIAGQLGLKPEETETAGDNVQYGISGGFQNLWNMQKMQIPVVKAGSVLVFKTGEAEVPSEARIGSMKQEGLGRVCVYSEAEMQGFTDIRREEIDKYTDAEDEEAVRQIEEKLTLSVVRETLLYYARVYRTGIRDIPVSRLRLMLMTAESYPDFLAKVGTIKTSDVSSEKSGRKSAAEAFLKDFYGEGGKISWEKLLESEPGLYEGIKNQPGLMEKTEEMWKLPLSAVLHTMHYTKGGKA